MEDVKKSTGGQGMSDTAAAVVVVLFAFAMVLLALALLAYFILEVQP